MMSKTALFCPASGAARRPPNAAAASDCSPENEKMQQDLEVDQLQDFQHMKQRCSRQATGASLSPCVHGFCLRHTCQQ